jgi:hypothetical protein
MAEIINLRRARKQRARAEREVRAETNRARHGRTKAEKLRDSADQERRDQSLDGHRIEPDDTPSDP